MERLFSEQKNKDGQIRLRINPIGRMFSDTNYFIDMTVCLDPTCDCGGSSIHILKEENIGTLDVEYSLPNNVYKERMNSQFHENFYSKEANGGHIQGLFANGLTKEDWADLKGLYYNRKFKQLEQINLDDITLEFDKEHHEDLSLMFPYIDAFPCSLFRVTLNGQKYEVLDLYCKNPTCFCTDVTLNTYEIHANDEGKTRAEHIGDYDYNYKTKQVNNVEGNRTIVTSVIRHIFNVYDDIEKLFIRRNKIVKQLYTKSMQIYHEENQARTTVKISRNQPCPCGSGKKYKRCCLKKDEARG